MSNKKENILKSLGEYLDKIFITPEVEMAVGDPSTAEKPAEAKPADKPADAPVAPEFKVGDPLPDGQYEIMDQIIVLKGGMIESITPKEAIQPEEEMTVKAAELEKEVAAINEKMAAQKRDFETELKKLADANKASGIIQAPVDTHSEPKVYTAKEIILRNIENRNK